MDNPVDVLVVGAGPVGLACAIEAKRQGLSARVIDKGALVNSIVGYPARMEFFSTPDLIEIGGYPFPVQGYKPMREEAIEYYRGVAAQEQLDIRLYERVDRVDGAVGRLHGDRPTRATHRAAHIVISTGFFDQPNRARRAGRGPAEGHALLPRAVPATSGRRSRSSARGTRPPRPRSTATATAPR